MIMIPTLRREDPRPPLITRSMRVRAQTIDEKTRSVRVTLATENAVRVWDPDLGIIDEVLRMDGVQLPESLQVVMLADHITWTIEQVRGSLRNLSIAGTELVCEAHFATDDASERAWQKVRGGHLTDLSVGYVIDKATRVIIAPGQSATVLGRTYTASDVRLAITCNWAPYEGSLVPIGADAASKVRAPHHHTNRATAPKEIDMTYEQWLKARGINPEAITTEQRAALTADFEKMQRSSTAPLPAPPATPPATPPVGDEATRAAELRDARERAAKAERSLTLRRAATTFSVQVTDAEIDAITSIDAGMDMLMQRKSAADQQNSQPPTGVGGITVTRHEADKFLARAHVGFMSCVGMKTEGEFANARALSSREIISRCALYDGHGDARDWSDMDLCSYALGRAHYVRSGGPNKSSSMFTTLLSSTADKILLAGFDTYDDITYEQWCTIGDTNSFKAFTVAGLSTGLMKIVKEGEAAQELKQKDGGYSAQLGVFGGTLTFTMQAMVDDELGEFMRSVQRVGANARRTIDIEAYRSLLNGTYTNDTSTGSGLATPTNLDKARAAFRARKDPVGKPMNASPRFLIHDPANAVAAQVATGQIYAPGQTSVPSQGSRSIRCIESASVSDTTLKVGALTTDYYLTGDPRLIDTVRVTFLRGVRQPFFMEFEQGAAWAQGFKFFLPLVTTQATHDDADGNTRSTGITKATAA
jgi:hypothetical protein